MSHPLQPNGFLSPQIQMNPKTKKNTRINAQVAKLADALDSKSGSRKWVRVQLPPWAPFLIPNYHLYSVKISLTQVSACLWQVNSTLPADRQVSPWAMQSYKMTKYKASNKQKKLHHVQIFFIGRNTIFSFQISLQTILKGIEFYPLCNDFKPVEFYRFKNSCSLISIDFRYITGCRFCRNALVIYAYLSMFKQLEKHWALS
jgi:hypothetical protein